MSNYDGIDLLRLYSGTLPAFSNDFIFYGHRDVDDSGVKGNASKSHAALSSHEKWNHWLSHCYQKNDLKELISVRRRLQVGMDDLVKKRLNSPEIAEMFIRWTASIEKTARRIIEKKYPMPSNLETSDFLKWKMLKKSRDAEFEEFLRKASF